MKKKIRIYSVVMVICFLFCALLSAVSGKSVTDGSSSDIFLSKKETIRLWYDDEALNDYLLEEAVEFNNSHKKVRLEVTNVSAIEYLETISNASAGEDVYPDLYIVTNDSLEKAYLSGLASNIESDILNSDEYPEAALSSVTYKGSYIAYPYYYETSTLLYNKTYLRKAAKEMLEEESSSGDDSAKDSSSNEITDEQIEGKMEELLPSSISDIITFAESYNAPETLEAVFKWDVSDIFYNFFVVGNYLNIGSETGDDKDNIDIYNENTITCMQLYSELNQFFAIDSEQISYDSVIEDFINGKILFTIATTDVLNTIQEAKDEGICDYEFGVCKMPSLTSEYDTRTMSVTRCIVVNGYSENKTYANEVATWLCTRNDDNMYNLAGKVSANKNVIHDDSNLDMFYEAYSDSVPMPKMIGTSNFWMQLEIAFEKIWDGEDSNETLKAVSEQIKKQVYGEEITEDTIEVPEKSFISNEYEDSGIS